MLSLFKSIFLGLNELVTLGGATAARDAHQALSEELRRYQSYYGRAESHQKELEQHITSIGEKLTAAQKTLAKAEKLIQRNLIIKHHSWQAPDRSLFEDIRKFKNNIHRSLTGRRLMNFAGIGIGTSSGGALSVGSWALVASLGSASTGTAISTLAGAAASNATLAWFGGGAIAAGGAGMSGGSVVLGLFATVPVIFFATWLTYRQAKKYEAERKRVIELRQKLEHSFHNLLTSLIVVHKKRLEISAFCDDFQYRTQSLFKELEPEGFVNVLKRRVPWLARKNNSSPASVEARKQLEQFSIEFLKRLAANKFI